MKISSVKGIREEEVERTIPEGIAEEVNQVAPGIISKPRYFFGGRGCEDSRKKASRGKNSWRSRPRYNCREDLQECRGDCKRVGCYRRASTIFSLWSIRDNGREILFGATEIQIRDR